MTEFLKKISEETEKRRHMGDGVVLKGKRTAVRSDGHDSQRVMIPVRHEEGVAPKTRRDQSGVIAKPVEIKTSRTAPAPAPAASRTQPAVSSVNPARTGAERTADGNISSSPAVSNNIASPFRHSHGEAASGQRRSDKIKNHDEPVLFQAAPHGVRRGRRGVTRFVLGGVLILAGLVGILLTTVFSHVTIAMAPVMIEKTVSPFDVIADTNAVSVDPEKSRIPGLMVTLERLYTGRYAATGKKYIEAYATGHITIFNALSSLPQALIKNTRFVTPDGKVFRITKNLIVPGAEIEDGKIVPSSVEAEVVADKAGEAYNIGPSDFTIPGFQGTPKYTAFTAKSNTAFAGGFQGESLVATADDIRNGQEQATRELFLELKKELEEKIPESNEFVVLDGARNILITDVRGASSGTPGDTFALEARGKAEVLILKQADVFALLSDRFLSGETPTHIVEDQSAVEYGNVRFDADRGMLSFAASGRITAARVIPEDEIRTAAVSRSWGDLERVLRAREEISSFRISAFPSWLWKTPSRTDDIRINIEIPPK